MSWRITSRADPHRWLAWTDPGGDDGGISGDDATLEDLGAAVDGYDQVALTVTGPFRDVESLSDEVGVFLLALQGVLPGPHDIIGSPPREETPATEIPEGAVA